MNSLIRLVATFLVIATHSALAEVFTCLDQRGLVSYQDTSCSPTTLRSPIDARLSNTLSLETPAHQVSRVTSPRSESRAVLVVRATAQRRQLHRMLLELDERRVRCELLNTSHNAIRAQERSSDRRDSAADQETIREMQDICANQRVSHVQTRP